MATQIQLRRGTASAWTSANPTLAQGELGLESDTGKFKVGNGTSTWTSLPYSSGVQGPQGSTGPQGFQGVTGAASTVQGPQGFQGPQGTQGNQGAVGATGNVGPQGSTGFQGYQGSQGSQGVAGTNGAQGAQGAAGSNGIQGSQGAQGAQGSAGAAGAQGSQGSQGPAGAQGSAGAAGAQGPQGSQGVQGAQGATTVGTTIDVTAASSTTTPLTVRGAAAQTAPLTEWRNSSGTVLAYVDPNGTICASNGTFISTLYVDGNGPRFTFGTVGAAGAYGEAGAFSGALKFLANNRPIRMERSDNGTVMQVRGISTQTANLQEWQNSSGTALALVTSSGEVRAALIDGGSA